MFVRRMFAECSWLFGCVLSPIILPLSATRPVWPVSPVCSDLCPTPHPVITAAAELDLFNARLGLLKAKKSVSVNTCYNAGMLESDLLCLVDSGGLVAMA